MAFLRLTPHAALAKAWFRLLLTAPFACVAIEAQAGSTPPEFRYAPDKHPGYSFVNLDPETLDGADAIDGLNHLLRGDGFTLRLPFKLAKSSLFNKPVDWQLRNRGWLPNPFVSRLDEGKPVPLNQSMFAKDGISYTNSNCMMCHGSVVGTQVIAGLANKDLNSPQLLADAMRFENGLPLLMSLAGLKPVEREATRGLVANTRAMIAPFFRFATSVGDNQGPFFSWGYVAHLKDPKVSLDETIAEGERTPLTELLYGQAHFPTVQAMAWWNIKYKTSHYWYRDSAVNLQQAGVDFVINFSAPAFTGPRPPFAERAAITRKILAYAYQTKSPPFPGELDAASAERGRALFHGQTRTASGATLPCFNCHGTYARKEDGAGWLVSYPNTTPLRDVGTDPAYNEILKRLKPIADSLASAGDVHGEMMPQYGTPSSPGYVAPPLDGVWASAPYFHNGSVPTLEQVLNPDARMPIWAASEDPTAYDLAQVGLSARELSLADVASLRKAAKYGSPIDEQVQLPAQRIYDTREPGKSNRGHEFGRVLSAAERADVIAFLKTLGGPGMSAAPR